MESPLSGYQLLALETTKTHRMAVLGASCLKVSIDGVELMIDPFLVQCREQLQIRGIRR